jgi:hypothetical protein
MLRCPPAVPRAVHQHYEHLLLVLAPETFAGSRPAVAGTPLQMR